MNTFALKSLAVGLALALSGPAFASHPPVASGSPSDASAVIADIIAGKPDTPDIIVAGGYGYGHRHAHRGYRHYKRGHHTGYRGPRRHFRGGLCKTRVVRYTPWGKVVRVIHRPCRYGRHW